MTLLAPTPNCHPGLVPGSTAPFAMPKVVARWTPAQGRGDEGS
jgi:hypothetical protein